MRSQGVVATRLTLLRQSQVGLGHFEEAFDGPTFIVDADRVLICMVEISGK